MSDEVTTLDTNTTSNGTTVVRREGSKDDPPKLKTNRIEEYHRWRRYIKWWTATAKIPKERHGTHVMMHCLLNEEISELAQALTDEEVIGDDGLDNLLKMLDEHFLSNSDSRLFQLCRNMRNCEKTEVMSWKEHLRKIQQAFRDLEKFGIKFEDKVIGIAMTDGTNLDAGTKLHIESVARNLDAERKLIPKHVADSTKRWMWRKKCSRSRKQTLKQINVKNKHCGCNEADHMADLEVNQGERFQHQPDQMQQEDSEPD